tara:strand:+ start:110 stop:490 length:381 start_codon:yes stop_codon:yes gene_type:complete
MEIKIPVSVGELVDKITILEIKTKNVKETGKSKNIENELSKLNLIYADLRNEKLDSHYEELKTINEKLWNIEDEIRILEKNKNFGTEFIELARSVYITNDKRFDVKSKINSLYDSNIVEEKLYEEY